VNIISNPTKDKPAIASFWLWYGAFAFAAVFLYATGLMPEWGKWYSQSPHYREQTEALLRGSLALHSTATAMTSDLAWHNGGVQQVWGLGVPVWRLPFELLAKIAGQRAFPDRWEFGLALLLLAYAAGKTLLSPANGGLTPLNLAKVLVVVLAPGLVMLCRHADVYEEAVAYSYLCATGLFLGLLSFVRAPSPARYLALATLAGLAPFVRPTAGAFGFATMLLLLIFASKAGFGWRRSFAGLLLYGAGGCLLFVTNQIRFGAGLEFGHDLNMTGDAVQIYTRFHNPFAHEPPLSAARELFGGLFGSAWHSATPRWRQTYLPTFDLSYLLLPVLVIAAWLYARRLPGQKGTALPRAATAAWIWSGIAFVILSGFYFRLPVSSSRYLLDFAPAFAAAVVAALFGLDTFTEMFPGRRRLLSWGGLAFVVVWTTWEFGTAHTRARLPAVIREDQAVRLALRRYPALKPLPYGYNSGDELANYGINGNGYGWTQDGSMAMVNDFYVSDPQYLKLTLAPLNPRTTIDYDLVQAKIGLELLERESIQEQDGNRVITFKPPRREVYRSGVQMACVAYVDKTNLVRPFRSPLRLSRIEWRPANDATNATSGAEK
jgi:hypothetical protein